MRSYRSLIQTVPQYMNAHTKAPQISKLSTTPPFSLASLHDNSPAIPATISHAGNK